MLLQSVFVKYMFLIILLWVVFFKWFFQSK